MPTPENRSWNLRRPLRLLYILSMGLGFPLWLFTSIVLTAWAFFASGGVVQDIGPLEYPSPTLSQMAVMKASILGFFLAYLAVFFFAHRITKHPWTVFAAMLAPVSVFCWAIAEGSLTGSKEEQFWALFYIGGLAAILTLGCVVGILVKRDHPAPTVCHTD